MDVQGLVTEFPEKNGKTLRAVDGIDIEVLPGEIHGLVGESGCGKTITSLSILKIVPRPGRIVAGKIFWKGKNLLNLSTGELRKVRGGEIAMIFQNPQAALNPLYQIGEQLTAILKLHGMRGGGAADEAIKLLRDVNIPDPVSRIKSYPHQLSGGMCQRVMVAMALACRPHLLIADEPTAALDVTIQAQILDLLLRIRKKFQMAILLISHDMSGSQNV